MSHPKAHVWSLFSTIPWLSDRPDQRKGEFARRSEQRDGHLRCPVSHATMGAYALFGSPHTKDSWGWPHPTLLAYLLSLGHVSVALGTDGAGCLGRLEGCAVHFQPPQVTAPEAALIHNACLRRPPTAGTVPRGLVCTNQMQSGLALE